MSPEQKQTVLQEFEFILKRATEKHASDLHLKSGLPPIVRVNGNLFYLGDESKENITRLTPEHLRVWVNALLNNRQKEAYEAGEEIDLGFELQSGGRFRINICQQRGLPRLVCRYIPDRILTIDELGLPPAVKQLALSARGLLLVTGATGSGKSTTLAAIIDHIARTQSCHIVTIEDPIEFIFKDRRSVVTQREIGIDTRTFPKALKYALRQDPDVILVGEMRDEETVEMAINGAETGHLVLSTLHTNDASETINRVIGSMPSKSNAAVRAQLASTLIGVISQRLIPRADKKGRIAAHEIMVCNARVREMIIDPERTISIRNAIEESENIGMCSFDQSLMRLYRQKLISEEEALANCTNVRDFQMRLQGVVSTQPSPENNPENQFSAPKVDFGNFGPSIEIESVAVPNRKKKMG